MLFTKLPTAKKGEDYASCIYFVTAFYTTEPELTIIKEI